MFNKKEFFKLEERSIIKIFGKDKFSFIQGIISNDAEILKKNSIYSSILSPQGRFISDFFLSSINDSLFLEVDKKDEQEIIQKLKMYKLRSDVELIVEKNISIYLISNDSEKIIEKLKSDFYCFDDPRYKKFFKRLYIFNNVDEFILETFSLKKVSDYDFNNLRLKYSIPDFSFDATKNKSLLLEMRFDELNGISWTKGCYMGQEITARMKYRQLMKKKLFKIKITFKKKIDEEIKFKNEVVGRITSHNKIDGLAYINLKRINTFIEEDLICGDSIIKLQKIWWSND